MNPLISIIVPNFNSQNTIKSTLKSIQNQIYKNYECIIIDDNSSDDSLKIIRKTTNSDKRFKVISSKISNGVSITRNIGISKAKGRYLTFLDSDDIWDKDFLQNNLNIRVEKNIPISHCSYIRFRKYKCGKIKGALITPPKLIDSRNILFKNYLPLVTVFIDRQLVKEIKFEEIRPEDYDLWINLIMNKKFYSISTNKISCYYRISKSQRSKNKFGALKRINSFYKKKLMLNSFALFIVTFRWALLNLFDRIKIYRRINYYSGSDYISEVIKI